MPLYTGEIWESNSGCQVWWQASLPTKLSDHGFILTCVEGVGIPLRKELVSHTRSIHFTSVPSFLTQNNNLLTHPPYSSVLDSLALTASKTNQVYLQKMKLPSFHQASF